LGQNVSLFDGRPGPGKEGHKNAKTSPLVTPPPREPPTQNWKKIFDSELLDLLNP